MTIARNIPLEQIPEAALTQAILDCTNSIELSMLLAIGVAQFPHCDWGKLVEDQIKHIEKAKIGELP